MPMNKTHTIDAKGRTIGRVASEAAKLLMGKTEADFERHKMTGGSVTIVNASKMKIDDKKLDTVTYERYSGYPGGLKIETLAQVIDKKGYAEVLKRAVKGMIPANKLRPRIIKNLIVND